MLIEVCRNALGKMVIKVAFNQRSLKWKCAIVGIGAINELFSLMNGLRTDLFMKLHKHQFHMVHLCSAFGQIFWQSEIVRV